MASAALVGGTERSADEAPAWATSRAHAPLVQLLRRLPLDECSRAACVCRTWRDAAAEVPLDVIRFGGVSRSLSDATLVRLCARAGAVLRELRLDACQRITAGGVVTALRDGRCAGLQCLKLPAPGRGSYHEPDQIRAECLSDRQARRLAAACPALEHAACCVRPKHHAAVCKLLPGPLTLFNDGRDDRAHVVLRPPARVATLIVQHRTLGEPHVAELSEVLRTSNALTALLLERNGIGDAGAATLSAALRANGTLRTLQLQWNDLGDAGAAALSETLRTNCTLTTLTLTSNQIGEAGAAALGNALRANNALTTLDLAQGRHEVNSYIGDAGSAALGDALRTNSSLTTLTLNNARIGPGVARSAACTPFQSGLQSASEANSGEWRAARRCDARQRVKRAHRRRWAAAFRPSRSS